MGNTEEQQAILDALELLEADNDKHWTEDGQPRVDAVSEIVGSDVTREQIKAVADGFTRDHYKEESKDESKEEASKDESNDDVTLEELADDEEAVEAIDAEPLSAFDEMDEEDKDDYMKQNFTDLIRTDESLALGQKIVAERVKAAKEGLEAAKAIYDKMCAQSDLLTRVADKRAKANPNAATDGIKQVLNQARKNREEQAAKLKKFRDAGLNPEDVAEALQTKSKIDRVMNQRKTGFGSQRPQMPRKG